MSEPEIARRCQSCGASIRDLAFFCPQCGKELKTTGELTQHDPNRDKPSTAVATAPLNEAPEWKEQLDANRSADKKPKVEAPKTQESKPQGPKPQEPKPPEPTYKNPADRGKGTPNPAGRAKGAPGAHAFAEARGKVQRATGLARNVGGDVIQRGQKLREMSSVVLDEAGYDPSLRFVLVAAVLFLLFLVIVLLNRFIV